MLKLYRVNTSFDSYIVKAANEERAKELVWFNETEAISESWIDEYDAQELDVKNMNVPGHSMGLILREDGWHLWTNEEDAFETIFPVKRCPECGRQLDEEEE